jgi:hypothetical protein
VASTVILSNFTRQRKKRQKINDFTMYALITINWNLERIKDTRKMTVNIILRIPQETRKFLALIDYAAEKNFIS